MPLMDLLLPPARLRAFRTRQLQMSRRNDSSPNATGDIPGSDLLRDIKPYRQYAQERVDPRWCLLLLRVRSRRLKFRLSLRAHAVVKNTRVLAKPTLQMNPCSRDKRFEWNRRSINRVSLR